MEKKTGWYHTDRFIPQRNLLLLQILSPDWRHYGSGETCLLLFRQGYITWRANTVEKLWHFTCFTGCYDWKQQHRKKTHFVAILSWCCCLLQEASEILHGTLIREKTCLAAKYMMKRLSFGTWQRVIRTEIYETVGGKFW